MGMLARVPLAGGAPREILSDVISADWSPDGKELAVRVWGRHPVPDRKGALRGPSSGFLSSFACRPTATAWRSSTIRGGTAREESLRWWIGPARRRVLTDEWAKAGPILWSPTGDEVFFTRWGGNERRGAPPFGGHAERRVDSGARRCLARAGCFSIPACCPRTTGGSSVRAFRTRPRSATSPGSGAPSPSDLSADGKQLLLYEEGEQSRTAGRRSSRPTCGPRTARTRRGWGTARALALSPDRQWALVARTHPETHLVLLPRSRASRGGSRRGSPVSAGAFFPDGRRIMYNADHEMGDIRRYVQDVEGGPPKELGEGFGGRSFRRTDALRRLDVSTVSFSCRTDGELLLGRYPGILGASPLCGAPTVGRSIPTRRPKSSPFTVWISPRDGATPEGARASR